MILSNYSEDKILEELLCDYKIIAKEAKKHAQKEVLRQLKLGHDGIDSNISLLRECTTTKLNNKWLLAVVINMSKKIKWYHQCVCCVENVDHKSKDYFVVRGFSNNKPYYIKISSHVLKRCRERLFQERLRTDINDLPAGYIVPLIIRKGEIIPWMKITDPRLLKAVLESKDRYEINTLFYTYSGCFLGYETEKGNVEFNTFLNDNNNLKKQEENIALYMCKLAHVAFNKKYYSKQYIEEMLNDDTPFPDIIGEVMMKYTEDYKLLP